MDTFLQVVAPLFAIVALGWGVVRLGRFPEKHVQGLASFVFDFAVPCMLFRAMATLEPLAGLPWRLIVAYYVGAFTVFAAGAGLASLAGAAREERVTAGFGAAFSNTILLGIPVVLTAFGEQAAAPLFSIVAVHSLFLLTAAIVAHELARGANGRMAASVATGLRGMMTNPILLALAAGLLWRATGAAIPVPLDQGVSLLGQAATPCALFAMGGSLARYRVAGHLRPACLVVALKNFAHPLIVWSLADRVFGLDPLWTAVAVVVAAMPTGVNVYLFADRYGGGTAVASSSIVLSTLVSLVTVTVLLALAP